MSLQRAGEASAPKTQQAHRHAHRATRGQQLLTGPEVCGQIGISRMTWFRWVKSRQAPAPVPNMPGHARWSVEAIERFRRGQFVESRRGR